MTGRSGKAIFGHLRPFREEGIRLNSTGRLLIASFLDSPAFGTDEGRAEWVLRTIWTVTNRAAREPGAYARWIAEQRELSVLNDDEERRFQDWMTARRRRNWGTRGPKG